MNAIEQTIVESRDPVGQFRPDPTSLLDLPHVQSPGLHHAIGEDQTALTVHRVAAEAWDRTIEGFDDICQEQMRTYSALRWPSCDLECLVFRQNDSGSEEIVGGALMMLRRLPAGLGTFAICKWGPMLKSAGADAAGLYRRMFAALKAEYADRRGFILSIMPHCVDVANERVESDLLALGFVSSANTLFPQRYYVDLQFSEEQHRKLLHQKWRYHLGKSERAGLTVECADGDRLPEFTALYEQMVDRKKFPDFSAFMTLPGLVTCDAAALRPRLFFVRHQNKVIAGAAIFTAGRKAVYLYGATDECALKLRAGYFTHWEIIKWLKANAAARWYDLGGTDGFTGLRQFKSGMVGQAGYIRSALPGFHYARSARRLRIALAVFKLRDYAIRARTELMVRVKGSARSDQIAEKA